MGSRRHLTGARMAASWAMSSNQDTTSQVGVYRPRNFLPKTASHVCKSRSCDPEAQIRAYPTGRGHMPWCVSCIRVPKIDQKCFAILKTGSCARYQLSCRFVSERVIRICIRIRTRRIHTGNHDRARNRRSPSLHRSDRLGPLSPREEGRTRRPSRV